MNTRLNDINIDHQRVLLSPAQLKIQLPLSNDAREFVAQSRNSIGNILRKVDHRQLVVVGPCSIHDITAAKEYALKLKSLQERLKHQLFIVMRVYFEKPRTTTGWKGLINDPKMDDSFDIELGLTRARELLIWLAENGLAAGTEMLDPISPQYLADLISWGAIGARTSESQTHREMASGLSMPVGFKNGTDGSTEKTINALQAAASSHRFLGINQAGTVTLLTTRGNQLGHVILRGGKTPNYEKPFVLEYQQKLAAAGITQNIMIDCSHGNSGKDHNRQKIVLKDICKQLLEGNKSIIGFMLESHLNAGRQSLQKDLSQLEYGVSITDACIDWQTTENLLIDFAAKISQRK